MHFDRYGLPENFQIWGKLVWQSDSAVRINGNIFIKQVGAGTRINAARGLFTLVVTKNLQEKPPSWKWIIVKIAQYLLPWLRQAVWTTTWENIVCLNKMQFPLQNQRFARDNMSNYTHGKYLRNIQIWILPCASRGRLASEMSRNDLYIFFVSSHLKLIWQIICRFNAISSLKLLCCCWYTAVTKLSGKNLLNVATLINHVRGSTSQTMSETGPAQLQLSIYRCLIRPSPAPALGRPAHLDTLRCQDQTWCSDVSGPGQTQYFKIHQLQRSHDRHDHHQHPHSSS